MGKVPIWKFFLHNCPFMDVENLLSFLFIILLPNLTPSLLFAVEKTKWFSDTLWIGCRRKFSPVIYFWIIRSFYKPKIITMRCDMHWKSWLSTTKCSSENSSLHFVRAWFDLLLQMQQRVISINYILQLKDFTTKSLCCRDSAEFNFGFSATLHESTGRILVL